MPLPDNPSLDWLRKQAKRRLEEGKREAETIHDARRGFDDYG